MIEQQAVFSLFDDDEADALARDDEEARARRLETVREALASARRLEPADRRGTLSALSSGTYQYQPQSRMSAPTAG